MHFWRILLIFVILLLQFTLAVAKAISPKVYAISSNGNSLIKSTQPAFSISFTSKKKQNHDEGHHTASRDPLKDFFTNQSKQTKRRIEFWKRAGRIYSSYKIFQIQQFLQKRLPFLPKPSSNDTESAWHKLHELNSDRMLNLSLTMRGFYLKSGQFLGTRHDFMPPEYTTKLSTLHDQVPPMSSEEVKEIIEKELDGSINDYFSSINLEEPIGSASIAQVHYGILKSTNEKVAIKVQNPYAKELMINDLNNLNILANFLQRTELKFDILSAIKELQKQIKYEFNFHLESENMNKIRLLLMPKVKNLIIPKSIYSTERLLIMTFIDGDNLSKLARKSKRLSSSIPTEGSSNSFAKVSSKFFLKQFGRTLLTTLGDIWGYQIFTFNHFHADPHPGNICIQQQKLSFSSSNSVKIGLLDWGQMKSLPQDLHKRFSEMIIAISSRNSTDIVHKFHTLGIKVNNPKDDYTIEGLAITLFDTKQDPKYIMSPFNQDAMIKKNPILSIPPDLFFVVRTVQILRGLTYSLGISDFSLAEKWEPFARKALLEEEE